MLEFLQGSNSPFVAMKQMKWKIKNTTLSEQFQNKLQNIKIMQNRKIDTPNTQIQVLQGSNSQTWQV
jgi:hypothetical protein